MAFTMKRTATCLTLAFGLAAGAAMAQDSGIGEQMYQERCAVCHGADGAGDGIVGELFAQKPKNLTLLAEEHNGAFPFSMVYQSIDGRRDIAGHGATEMPIWGEYFMDQAIDDPTVNDKNARIVTQGRILALVYYLQSIQK